MVADRLSVSGCRMSVCIACYLLACQVVAAYDAPTITESTANTANAVPGRQLRRRGRWKLWRDQEGDQAKVLCRDTCEYAMNSVCEDGRREMANTNTHVVHRNKLLCDLGTDCSDCGDARAPAAPASLAQMLPGARATTQPEEPQIGPVASLRKRKVDLRAAWTKTQPSFLMPFTNPSQDIDVSRNMEAHRAVEPLYNWYWHKLSRQCCAAGGLMLDVGVGPGLSIPHQAAAMSHSGG